MSPNTHVFMTVNSYVSLVCELQTANTKDFPFPLDYIALLFISRRFS